MSRIYRIAEINIPSLKLYSAQSDIICVLDDAITLLIPDGESGKTTFKTYEAPVVDGLVVRAATSGQLSATIVWGQEKGYMFLKARKCSVEAIHLRFLQDQDLHGFVEAFNGSVKDLGEPLLSQTASQRQIIEEPPQRKCSIALIDMPSDAEASTDEDAPGAAPDPHGIQEVHGLRLHKSKTPRKVTCIVPEPSSDVVFGRGGPSSDVFGPGDRVASGQAQFEEDTRTDEEDHQSKRSSSHENNAEGHPKAVPLKARLLASKAQGAQNILTGRTPSSDDNEQQVRLSPSPLERQERRHSGGLLRVREGAVAHQDKLHVQDPALTQALAASDDQDFASFRNTINKADAPTQQKSSGLSATQKKPSSNQERTTNRPGKPHSIPGRYPTDQTQAQHSKPATLMPRIRNVEDVQSQHIKTSLAAGKSTTKLKPVKKADTQEAANASIPSVNHDQGAQASVSDTIRSAVGSSKATDRLEQKERVSKLHESIYDLDADSVESDSKRPRAKQKKTVGNPISRKPLKDQTNVDRPAGSWMQGAKKTNNAKAGKKKQSAQPQKSEPQPPTRRSQRAVAKQATTYEGPSESDLEKEEQNTQEELVHSDTPDEEADADNSGKRRWASQLKQKNVASKKIAIAQKQVQAKTSTAQASPPPPATDRAGENITGYHNNTNREGPSATESIIVPSNDTALESGDAQLAQPMQQTSTTIDVVDENTTRTQPLEQSVAEDSYAKEAPARRSDGGADASFGSKLKTFAMITSLPQARADIKQNSAPFGDAKKFIRNVNGARTSASPVREQLITDKDRYHAKGREDTQHVDYGKTQPLGGASVPEASLSAWMPADGDDGPLVMVQDDNLPVGEMAHVADVQDASATLVSVARIHAAVSEQISEAIVETRTGCEDRQVNDEEMQAGPQAPSVDHQSEVRVGSRKDQQQSTAKSVEIADSQDRDVTDDSTVGEKVKLTEAVPPGSAARSIFEQSAQVTAHDEDPIRDDGRGHKANQRKADALSARAQEDPASAAIAPPSAPTEQSVGHIQPRQRAIRTSIGHAFEEECPPRSAAAASADISQAPRKSRLIHFGSAGPQNQGSPIKTEAEAPTSQVAGRSLAGMPSFKGYARHSGVASQVHQRRSTSLNTTREDNVDESIHGGETEVNQEPSPRAFDEVAVQGAQPEPEPQTSDEPQAFVQALTNGVCEQSELPEPRSASLMELEDQAADDIALTSRKSHARRSEFSGKHGIKKVSNRTPAPQPVCTAEESMPQTHTTSGQILVDKMEPLCHHLPKVADAVSIDCLTNQVQVRSTALPEHGEGDGSSNVSTVDQENLIRYGSAHVHGEQLSSLAQAHSSLASQASSKKVDWVPTQRVSHGKDTNDHSPNLVAQTTATATQAEDHHASALDTYNIKTVSGSSVQVPALASARALASVRYVVTQGRSPSKPNTQHKSTFVEAVSPPTARIRSQPPQSQSVQAGNSQESPVNISSTELISEQDSSTQSEQESEFEASAVNGSLLPPESPRFTRRTASPSEPQYFSSSDTEEQPFQEQPPPPAKRRKVTKAEQMAQTMIQRPQAPDDISHFVQRQFPTARSTISFMKTTQAEPPSALPFDLDLTNIFGARDVARYPPVPSIVPPFQFHKAHLSSNMLNHQTPASAQVKPAEDSPCPKKTNMPPPARPTSRIDQTSMHTGNTRQAQSSKKGLYREEPSRPQSNDRQSKRTSNIKRVRQVLNPPVNLLQTVVPACTPQPFHERLLAATSPSSNVEAFSASALRRTSHGRSETGDTTLVEPCFLLRNAIPRSPSAASTNPDSRISDSPQPDNGQTRLSNASPGHVLGLRASSNIQQSLQQAILAMTQVCTTMSFDLPTLIFSRRSVSALSMRTKQQEGSSSNIMMVVQRCSTNSSKMLIRDSNMTPPNL